MEVFPHVAIIELLIMISGFHIKFKKGLNIGQKIHVRNVLEK